MDVFTISLVTKNYVLQVDLGGLPALVTNHIMKQEPLSIQFINDYLDRLQREGALNERYLSLKNRNSIDGETTAELPTPGIPHQDVRFSSISFGSNPLYQQSWSMSTRTPGKHFINRFGLGECDDQQNQSCDKEGPQLVSRRVSAVLEEPELEDQCVEGDQLTDQVKEQSLMFEVSMAKPKRSGMTLNLDPNK